MELVLVGLERNWRMKIVLLVILLLSRLGLEMDLVILVQISQIQIKTEQVAIVILEDPSSLIIVFVMLDMKLM